MDRGKHGNFADDHPIEMIRGLKSPKRATILRALAHRAAWLSNRMELDARTNVRPAQNSIFMLELMAIAHAVAAIDRVAELEREIAELRGAPLVANANDENVSFAERFDEAIVNTHDKVAEKLALKERARP